MRYGITIIFALFATIMIGCSSQKEQTAESSVHIQGHIIDLGTEQIQMKYNGKLSYVGDSRDITLRIDAEGYVDTTLTITTPSYYSIGRNTLYLTPGDELIMKISPRGNAAEFSGRGAEANNYLKGNLLPKRGSFLEAGHNVRESFEETKKLIDSLAQVRMNTLDTLSGVSDEFKNLERARIKADVINSYIYYPRYSDNNTGPDAEKVFAEMWQKHTSSIAEDMNTGLKEISTDTKYLEVLTVREVLKHHRDSMLNSLWFEGIEIPQNTIELYETAEYTTRLKGNVSEALAKDAQNYLSTIKDADLANELKNALGRSTKLFPGRPAIDFEIMDAEGNTKRLSDFKGKLIYVDLWATWCGPCLKEAPAFDALGKKYEGKEIVFIPIGTDKTKEPWLEFLKNHKKELIQYYSTDLALKRDWAVEYIPRFLLIDKDFKIIDAFAPRPSDEAASKLIDTWLDK
ncbi:MAG: TlpA disulfide reductase family protein [Porphyromonas sp.]|nr:TlpA disulfide reductase family protein [Porphyromonas sp.]MDO4695861.1 TlpA disulfide reductase family protein [Porphyromonas sp.]MDO4771803.1 TlpA disulfide reductase family protein [Porphyromonas sp.]